MVWTSQHDIRIPGISQTANFTVSVLLVLLRALFSKDDVYLIEGIIAAASVWIHELRTVFQRLPSNS